jgi:ATP-dependent exoDNAse (exonuclease V) beta subunit
VFSFEKIVLIRALGHLPPYQISYQQDKFETMRLLYVAMTRAKSNLHLLGAVNKSGKSIKGSFLHLLMPFYVAISGL